MAARARTLARLMIKMRYTWLMLSVLFIFITPYITSLDRSQHYDEVIDVLKKQILLSQRDQSFEGIHRQADLWLQLAIYIQSKDIRIHSGGLNQIEALEVFNKAENVSNTYPHGYKDYRFYLQLYNFKGLLHKMMGNGNEALTCYYLAIEYAVHPMDLAHIFANIGDAMIMVGDLREALQYFKKAINLNPYKISVYSQIISVHNEMKNMSTEDWNELVGTVLSHQSKADKRIFQIYNPGTDPVLASASLIDPSSDIYWGLFIAADKANRIDESWKYLSTAHAIELGNRQDKFNPQEALDQLNHIKTIFQPNFWMNGVGYDSNVPIFIVGMMRSGSTLLETMLDAHKDIWGMGEDSIFNVNLPKFRDEIVVAVNDAINGKKQMKSIIRKHGKYIEARMIEQARNFTTGMGLTNHISHVVDKMLFNFRNIGFIHLMYPSAAIIHTMRDPMDTLFSCWKHKFDDSGLVWSLSEDHLVLQYYIYLEIMHHFRQTLPDRIIDVRYEALVANPKKILHRIIDRLGIAWDDNMLNFHSTKRVVHTHSQSQVRHGISRSSVGSWRKYSKQLESMRKKMKVYIDRLRLKDALPYAKQINWDLDPSFYYDESLESDTDNDSRHRTVNAKSSSKNPIGKVKKETKEDEMQSSYPQGRADLSDPSIRDHSISCRDIQQTYGKVLARLDKLYSPQIQLHRPNTLHIFSQLFDQSYDSNLFDSGKSDQMSLLLCYSYLLLYDSTSASIYSNPEEISIGIVIYLLDISLIERLSCPLESKDSSNPSIIDSSHGISYEGYYTANSFTINHLKTLHSLSNESMAEDMLQHIFNQLNSQNTHSQSMPSIHHDDSPRHKTFNQLWMAGSNILIRRKRYHDAETLLSIFLRLNPNHYDSRRQRIEIYGLLRKHDLAIEDLNLLIINLENNRSMSSSKLSKSSNRFDLYFIRGSNHFLMKFYGKAYKDLKIAFKEMFGAPNSFHGSYPCHEKSANLWNLLGKCEKELGDWFQANHSQSQAIACDSHMKEAYHDKAVALLEASYWEEAVVYLDKAIAMDPQYKNPRGYKALLYQNLGRLEEAIEELNEVAKYDPNDLQGQYLRSCYLQSLGRYSDAIKAFTRLVNQLNEIIKQSKRNNVAIDSDILSRYSNAWFRREVCAFQWIYLDQNINQEYNIDRVFHPRIKEGHTQQIKDRPSYDVIQDELINISYYKQVNKMTGFIKEYPNVDSFPYGKYQVCQSNPSNSLQSTYRPMSCEAKMKQSMARFIEITSNISSWIQLNSHGFLPNERQHRMFGLMVLEIAQTMQTHLQSHRGFILHDHVSSKVNYAGFTAYSERLGYHILGWRDVFDIAVKWRGVSEANDVVWWIDGIVSPKLQDHLDRMDQRIGLNTNMVSGLSKVVRYYPYFNQSFAITKEHLLAGYGYNAREQYLKLDESAKQKVSQATTLHQLYKAVYSQPMFVIPRIQSTRNEYLYLNGTRITLMKSGLPEGYDYSICSASTMERFQQYEEELHDSYMKYLSILESLQKKSKDLRDGNDMKTLLSSSLHLFYYWVNYAPITRGTSAVGYGVLYACILAGGYEIQRKLPSQKQLDWEAILSESPIDFIDHVIDWFHLIPTTISKPYLNDELLHENNCNGDNICEFDSSFERVSCEYRIRDVLTTRRSMLQAIHGIKQENE